LARVVVTHFHKPGERPVYCLDWREVGWEEILLLIKKQAF